MSENIGIEPLVEFTKHLRSEGFIVGMNETADIVQLISEFDKPDRSKTEQIIRAVTCSSASDWSRFETIFHQYWFGQQQDKARVDESAEFIPAARKIQTATTGFSGSSSQVFDDLSDKNSPGETGAGQQRTISKADFRFLKDSQAMLEAERMAEDLAKILRKCGKQKQIISTKGKKLALRQTIRSNLSYGGFPIKRRMSSKQYIKPHLLILHDVSHSMAWNNPLLFRFVRGLVRTFKDSDAFVFHTELFPVTTLYRERSIEKMRQQLEGRNHLWLGGTCIAESIQDFNEKYAKKFLKSNSIVIIISDGFDTNSPELLAEQLASIKQSKRKILWLNPMLGRKEYSQDNETIKAASPYIEKFLAAHSVDSLKDCIRYIRYH